MNNSGISVSQISKFYKISETSIYVFYDDIDLKSGQIKVKIGGGHGGHNGLRDIDQHIGKEYTKIFNERVKLADTPVTTDVRAEAGPHEATKGPLSPIQTAMGMLLWLYRCNRPDIGVAVSSLASRVLTWNSLCQEQLARVVGYVVKTAHVVLQMSIKHGEKQTPCNFMPGVTPI